jgi:hypothetical protein
LSFEVFTYDNVYTIEPGSFIKEGNRYCSRSFLWGDTEKTPGTVSLDFLSEEPCSFCAKASLLGQRIREVKFRLDDLPWGTLINSIDGTHQITEEGRLFHYPEGWRSPFSGLLVFALQKGGYLYLEIQDKEVRPIRYYLKKTSGGMRLDLVIEEVASKNVSSFLSPLVKLGFTDDLAPLYEKHAEYLRERYSYVPFEKRKDVPEWFKDVSLVVTLQMEGFTGHLFHTYESALTDAKKIGEKIDGRNVLFYLPGWEGRYYRDYGHYDAENRLGGKAKLIELVKGIHAMGSHVMAMYGVNLVSLDTPDFQSFGPQSEFHLCGGGRCHNGSVDWTGGHDYDFDGFLSLNIAKKPWQDHLYGEIERNVHDFDFDGAFLDIAALDINDREAEYLPGLFVFSQRIQTLKKGFLVSGEGCYDAMLMSMPLFQSGHTDGKMNYHDVPYEGFFTPYAREFAHLSLGDVAFHSTGVHELGFNQEDRAPLRKGILPTLSLIDGTLEKAEKDVSSIIQQAKEYRRLFQK